MATAGGSGSDVDIRALYEAVLDSLHDGVYMVDRGRRIIFWNATAERLSGYAADRVLGQRCADGLLEHCNAEGMRLCGNHCPLTAVMRDGKSTQAHVFMRHADGHRVPVHVRGVPVFDRHGGIIGALELFSDDTDRTNAMEKLEKLEREALIDDLTGLANRRYYNRVIEARLAEFRRYGDSMSLMMVDIDHFKKFNDTYGHDTGDRVLQLVARTLSHASRSHDTVTRWGGEEFAVVSDHAEPDQVISVAERLRSLVEASVLVHEGRELHVTISIGVAFMCSDDDAETLAARADRALYMSKAGGRNRVTVVDEAHRPLQAAS